MGSPPHRRGKGFKRDFSLLTTRITPAQAGKRLSEKTPAAAPWNHPRVGGEKIRCPTRTRRQTGSPPRGRGKDGEDHLVAQLPGITPAWAGKRRPQQRHRMALQDHPRVGGEKTVKIILWHSCQGSPLRGRGKEDRNNGTAWLYRITPAWAGKRTLCITVPHISQRITPAWAGKSSVLMFLLTGAGDHPRVGGEKQQPLLLHPTGLGSPPHRRGKVERPAVPCQMLGITPAQAGKSSACRRRSRWARDHPRTGGEKFSSMLFLTCSMGSPPRGRGKEAMFPP